MCSPRFKMNTVALYCIACLFASVYCSTEQGIRTVTINELKNVVIFGKSMYKNTSISLSLNCTGPKDVQIVVRWMLRRIRCINDFIKENEVTATLSFADQLAEMSRLGQKPIFYHESKIHIYNCSREHPLHLIDESDKLMPSEYIAAAEFRNTSFAVDSNPTTGRGSTTTPATIVATSKKSTAVRRRRSPNVDDAARIQATTTDVVKAWQDGMYIFEMRVYPVSIQDEMQISVNIRIKGKHGYLSAIEWPFLPFYSTMCAVYSIYGIIWLVLSACNWRDMLRVQFWIGAVILLGMLEKAVYVAEYERINESGVSVPGAVIFAELVSCLKRALARMLIVIVSLGFGIVKPRLGPMLHKVVGMGVLYFTISALEGCMRARQTKSRPSQEVFLASICLSVLDVFICWWIFSSLVATQRTLRLRRNLVKLSLYRHFTNTLIFAVIASLGFMIWTFQQYRMRTCITDWREIWVDDAFWHLLFSVILAVIMVLWRPTNNNQRYAFSPLRDAADEIDGTPLINDAFEGIKVRNVSQGHVQSRQKDAKAQVEDDLKWIDDNIPSTVADAALPSLLDSDDEIQTTRFEMSKMN